MCCCRLARQHVLVRKVHWQCRKPGKPAAAARDKGASVMQPVAAGAQVGAAPAPDAPAPAPASATLDALAQRDIAPEDVFFHKFMTLDSVKKRAAANRSKRKSKAAAKKAKEDDGDALPDGSSSDEDADGDAQDGSGSDAEDAFLDAAEAIEVRSVALRLLCVPMLAL